MILFDNIIITDDKTVADNWAAETFDFKRRKLDKDGVSGTSLVICVNDEKSILETSVNL
jgi:calnexin